MLWESESPWSWDLPWVKDSVLKIHQADLWIKEQMWKVRCWLGQPKSKVKVQITLRAQPQMFCTLTLLKGFAPTITETSTFVPILIVSEFFFVVSFFGMKRCSKSLDLFQGHIHDIFGWTVRILKEIFYKTVQFCIPKNIFVYTQKWPYVYQKRHHLHKIFT